MPILIGMALGVIIQGTAFAICVILERRENRKKLEAEQAETAPQILEIPPELPKNDKKYPCGNCGRMFAPHTCLKC